MKSKNTSRFQKLRKFNGVMGFIHLIQALLMLFLSTDKTLPIRTTYLEYVQGTGLISQTLDLIDIQLAPFVSLFLFMSAIAHFLIATVLYKAYVKNLKQFMNPFRWFEYAFSASVMIWIIAMLSGIYDVGTLIALFTLVGIMNLMGYLMEKYNKPDDKVDWSSYIIGCIAGAIPWIAIIISLLAAEVASGGQVPDFVWGIYISIGITFNIFAFNMVLQYKQVWLWEDYLYGETVYVVLSLVAKSLLAWQVFAGTLAP